MPTFTADFTGDTIGSAPAGFTSRWVSQGPLEVVSVASGTPNGRAVQTNRTTINSGRKFWSLDAAGSVATSQTRQLLRTQGIVAADAAGTARGTIIQGTGSAGAENGLLAGLEKADTSSLAGRVRQITYTAGVVDGNSGSPDIATLFNEWVWVINTYDGTNHSVQIKAVGTGFSEGAVLSSQSRAVTIGAGRAGIFEGSATAGRSTQVAWMSVGTLGDSAPVFFTPPAVLGVRNSSPLRRHNGTLVASETGISLFVYPRTGMSPSFGAPLRSTPYTVSTDASGNLQQSVADIVGLTAGDAVALVYYKAGTDFATGNFGCDFTTVVNL